MANGDEPMGKVFWMLGAGLLATLPCAHAQVCKDKIAVTTLYGRQTGVGRYEYAIQLQNVTKKPLKYTIDFKNMPAGVNVFKPTIVSDTALGPGQATTLRIGSGTNANINSNSVSIGYDKPGSAVTVSGCK